MEQVRPEAGSTGIEVDVRIDPAAGAVEADPERLRQVLLNLTRNALEAMSGEGVLTLATSAADQDGMAAISVSDTGPGIPDEAPVFDAFFTTKAEGTGLGLAIVHRIIQEHGGTIQYESKPGHTCFTLRLPTSDR